MSNYFVHTLLRARDWQHRPQFDDVCNWWRGGGQGVCALVGMGGAGKTAIADRFLNELLDETSTTRERVSPPANVFVYSFYDDDKPENFFRHMQIWLEGNSAPEKQKSPTQLMFDIQQHQGLIILDGLERVQESGARGGFGRLTSPSLRDLLNHIASGSARELSVLVTSRFPLTDLRDSQPRFFHTIAVDQIDVVAGIALLRDRGVRGTDVQLAPIVEHCGQHALTIDLAGGYIKEYGHGNPSTPLKLGTAEELQAESEQEPDDDKRAVLIQSNRFTRIAQRYREAMQSSDKAALALLERLCLFRLGVSRDTLSSVFLRNSWFDRTKNNLSGRWLARLGVKQLQEKLAWLVRMRIVTQFKSGTSAASGERRSEFYSIHPAVRAGFVAGIGRAVLETRHLAVRDSLGLLLGSAHDNHAANSDALNLMEELIYQAISSGRTMEAWDVFTQFQYKLDSPIRGDRICRMFANGDSPQATSDRILKPTKHNESERGSPSASTAKMNQSEIRRRYEPFSDRAEIRFLLVWARFLADLGQVSEASYCYEALIGSGRTFGTVELRIELSDLHILRGHLKRALVEYDLAQMVAQIWQAWKECAATILNSGQAPLVGRARLAHASQAYCLCLIGRLPDAIAHYQLASLPGSPPHSEYDSFEFIFGLPFRQYVHVLTELGRIKSAMELIDSAKTFGVHDSMFLNLADLACARSDLIAAHEILLAAKKMDLCKRKRICVEPN